MSVRADGKGVGAAVEAALRDPRFHAVLANPLRHEIVMRTAARPWSPTELAEATGYSPKHVSRALEALKKQGLVEPVGTKPGPRGGQMNLYRAVRFAIGAEDWERLSQSEQASATGKIVAELHADMAEALKAETFYSHPHHVMIRDHRQLDDEGMERCSEILSRAYEEILEAEHASLERGTDTFRVVIGLTAFPGAPEDPAE